MPGLPQIGDRPSPSTAAGVTRAPLYLDHAASTPPAPEVVDAMLPWLGDLHANPHSDHVHGRRAAAAVEEAREHVANLIGATAEGIIFTSGATESNNIAIQGALLAAGESGLLAYSAAAHRGVLNLAQVLSERGTRTAKIRVTAQGAVAPSVMAASLRRERLTKGIVTVIHANNELGTIQGLIALADVAHEYGHLFHVDASQSAGKVPLDVWKDGVDLASVSSHKMYGPAGIGALYVAPGVERQLIAITIGGGQERGVRPGTVPPFLAVGFGAAAKLALNRMEQDAGQLRDIASLFLTELSARSFSVALIGDPVQRLPGHLSFRLPGIGADDLLSVLSTELSASTGSACSSGELSASHVLRAIGMGEADAGEVVRVVFGRNSTHAHAAKAAEAFARGIERVRSR